MPCEADRPGVADEVLPQPESETLPRILGGDAPENMAASESPPPPDNVLYEVGSLQRLSDIPIQSAPSDMAQGPDDLAAAADNRQAVPAPERGPRAADAAGGSTAALPLGAAASVAEALATVPTVRRLADSLPMPDLLKLRNAANRSEIAAQLGCNERSEAAVEAALAWLAANQEPDGRWNASRHGGFREEKVLGHDRQSAGEGADSGVTGLALLAFLGAGHTHLEGTYRTTVQRGLEYLVAIQKTDGSLAGDARLFVACTAMGLRRWH